jgi:hypothetical protein
VTPGNAASSMSAAAVPSAPGASISPALQSGLVPQPVPPAIAAAEAAARQAAQQMATRGRAGWGQLDPTGKRPSLIVAGVLLAIVLGSQFLNALVPAPRGALGGGGTQPGPGRPVDIGSGIRVTPPPGWVTVGDPLELQGVRFQKGGVTVDVGLAAFTNPPSDLLAAYVNQVLIPNSQGAKVSPATIDIARNGHPTARATFTGNLKGFGTAVEGEISTQVWETGVGIIVNGFAPQGQLTGARDEIHAFVDSIEAVK